MKTKRINLFILSLLFTTAAMAGNGDFLINVGGGFLFPNTLNAEIGIEKEFRYGSALELYGEIGNRWKKCEDCGKVCKDSFWKGYYWAGGLNYKPVLKRYKNALLRMRFGPQFGAYRRQFTYGGQIGLEYNYVFPSGVQLSIIQKNQININHGDTFRDGLLIGVKIPL